MNNDEDDISLLLNELSGFEVPTKTKEVVQHDETPLKDEDVHQYFLNKTKQLVETSLATVQDLAPSVASSADAREMDGLSKLMSATAQALDVLNKGALIDKKADRDEKLERIRIEGRKEVTMLNQGPKQITNNNILVASREEIMKKLFSDKAEVLEIKDK